MSAFKKYYRKQIAELRPVTSDDINLGAELLRKKHGISISKADLENGSPKKGDMIARNPKNHQDQWLVAEDYFKENFEPC